MKHRPIPPLLFTLLLLLGPMGGTAPGFQVHAQTHVRTLHTSPPAPVLRSVQVWKCQVEGRVEFSDVPCPATGSMIEERRLRPNVIDTERRPVPQSQPEAVPYEPTPQTASAPPPRRRANVCPSDFEIRNMETSASSTTLGERERAFLRDEVRRARQCQNGQGQYTDQDWRISREAQAAQNNNTRRGEARREAEGMHSAADPIEGERIAQRAQQEAARQRAAAIRNRLSREP
jgi:hypothetical protein